jgi:hypothetical protein
MLVVLLLMVTFLRSLYGLFFRILGEVRSKKRDLINTALQLESRM